MRIFDITKRSGRNLRQAKARTLLTSLAIGVGAFALTLTLAASNGAKQFVNKIVSDNFDPAELIVTRDDSIFGKADPSKPKEYDNTFGLAEGRGGGSVLIRRLTDDDITMLKNTKGVESVREGFTVTLQYVTRPGQKKYIGTVVAFNPAQNPELLAGKLVKPLQPGTILLPEGYINSLGFKNAEDAIGKEIDFSIRKPINEAAVQRALTQASGIDSLKIQEFNQQNQELKKFSIAGVLKKPTTSQPGTELYMFIGQDDAKVLNDLSTKDTVDYRKYTYAYVRISGGSDKAVLRDAQNRLKSAGFTTQSVEDTQKFLTQIISVLNGIVSAFGAIAVIASVFGVINTMYISVLQRTREIGLMKALGMPKGDIGSLFLFEAAWIGFLGGALGSIAAFVTGTLLNPWITTKLDLGSGQKLLIFKLPQIVVLIVALMIIAMAAGLLPARKASKLDPIEALRTE